MELVTKHRVILEKTNNSFENLGVLNPAVIQDGKTVHLLYTEIPEEFQGVEDSIIVKIETALFYKVLYIYYGTADPSGSSISQYQFTNK